MNKVIVLVLSVYVVIRASVLSEFVLYVVI